MKNIKPLFISGTIFLIVALLVGYVYVGTYIFPIAPYWVTQLPPNPPTPIQKKVDIDFKLEYFMNGDSKIVEDTLQCEFKGFDVVSVGGPKIRVWQENLKNINGYELFAFRDEERKENDETYSDICIENIGQYKVILGIAEAEWFLGEPEYKGTPEMPYIQVYDTETKYYKDPEESMDFLNKYGFKIIRWTCDEPIKNEFK